MLTGLINAQSPLKGDDMIKPRNCNKRTREEVIGATANAVATNIDVTEGVVCAKYVPLADLLTALYTAQVNPIIRMKKGDAILDVIVSVGTAAGTAAVLDVGIDVDVDGTTADPVALITDANLNAVGVYSTQESVTDATEPTYNGTDSVNGLYVCEGDGWLTCTNSTDLKATTALVGYIKVIYMPGHQD